MTDPTSLPPHVPGNEPTIPVLVRDDQPRKSKTPWIIAGVVGFLLLASLVGALAVAAATDSKRQAAPAPVAGPGVQQVVPDPAAVEDSPTPPGPTPKVADFKLTPKVTDKQCFGEFGCNVEVRVDVGYNGPTLSEFDTWLLTYQVSGDESGPIIGSFDINGTTHSVNTEALTTPSRNTKITIKVLSVEKIGI